MNKLSKILLAIIILLVIALGIMIYYYFYWRDGYLSAANELMKTNEAIREKGYEIQVEDEGQTYVLKELNEDFLFLEEGK